MTTSENIIENQKQEVSDELRQVVEDAHSLARELGLDPYPVKYWIIDQEEMYRLMAYGGFQRRYPHWRWGMKYTQSKLKGRLGLGKAYELVNNDNPAHAFLQQSNSMADQKAVITHVEAHADFFKNNQWYEPDPDAVSRLSQHADKIEQIIERDDVSRDEVERWIDNVSTIQDTIAQHGGYTELDEIIEEGKDKDEKIDELRDKIDELGLRDKVKEGHFDEDWIDEQADDEEHSVKAHDVVGFLAQRGMQYDEDSERAVEMEDWQREIINILRDEAYYFAPQKMTKCMNEGWAAFWESMMMGNEDFADESEIIQYADHQSRVLGSPGFNPYKLGKELWEYIENQANRQEVVNKLLRVEGIDWKNFHAKVDSEEVLRYLEKPEHEDIAVRNFSLIRPQNRGVLGRISGKELEEMSRYMFNKDKYDSIEEALDEVDYHAGWDKMFDVRRDHNDITFIDEFLTQEFVDEYDYFAYEYSSEIDQMRVSSTDVDDVKKKLLLKFTNLGKPTVYIEDDNYQNRNELLLSHDYNGVMMNISKAKETLKRVFEMWGRPVNLRTIIKEGEGDEAGLLLRYDGEEIEETILDKEDVEDIAATEIDYDTKPDEWT